MTDPNQKFAVKFTHASVIGGGGGGHLVTDTTWRFILYSYIVAVVRVWASDLLIPLEEL